MTDPECDPSCQHDCVQKTSGLLGSGLWLQTFVFSGELKFNYLKRPYIVNVGSYLMGVLLSFNSSPTQGFQDLVSSTGLPEKELLRQLASLCETKILQTEVSAACLLPCQILACFTEEFIGYFSVWVSPLWLLQQNVEMSISQAQAGPPPPPLPHPPCGNHTHTKTRVHGWCWCRSFLILYEEKCWMGTYFVESSYVVMLHKCATSLRL